MKSSPRQSAWEYSIPPSGESSQSPKRAEAQRGSLRPSTGSTTFGAPATRARPPRFQHHLRCARGPHLPPGSTRKNTGVNFSHITRPPTILPAGENCPFLLPRQAIRATTPPSPRSPKKRDFRNQTPTPKITPTRPPRRIQTRRLLLAPPASPFPHTAITNGTPPRLRLTTGKHPQSLNPLRTNLERNVNFDRYASRSNPSHIVECYNQLVSLASEIPIGR